ncbi:hypothetical protein E2562_000181 [Oryza meyeriana var. granulata]|uniref:WAT1-related protein n=1 Tax=Oryza meyeriana var. granulata TaxID=110450 RepID=A0A6G1DBX0_9ORYZ|nr:hypothetical protein E2562_000181 [Oryza meyeriana var. granulata]
MGLNYYGLCATNAAYTINFLNLIPIVIFIIAIILRLEKLRLNTRPGIMKLRAIGGESSGSPGHHNILLGTLFLCGSCLSYAFWFIIQAKVSKEFPSKYFSTMLACLLGTIQAVVLGIAVDRDPSAWALHWDLQLLTIVY